MIEAARRGRDGNVFFLSRLLGARRVRLRRGVGLFSRVFGVVSNPTRSSVSSLTERRVSPSRRASSASRALVCFSHPARLQTIAPIFCPADPFA